MNANADASSTTWARASGSTTSPAGCSPDGTLAALHRRALGHRAHLQSRPSSTTRSASGTAYDDAIRRKTARRPVRRGALLRAGARGSDPGGRSLPAGARARPAASTAGSRSRCRRCWPTTPRSTLRAGAVAARGRPRGPTSSSRSRARPRGVPAIEESIFAGVPINVTLLFSPRAVPRGRRGLPARHRAPHRGGARSRRGPSVASLFVSRWDMAVQDRVPAELRNRLGIAIAGRTYRAYRELLDSPPLAARSPPRAPGRSGCSGPAPAPRTRRRPTCSTSRRWPRPTPSTPCPTRRCSPSPITARSAG